MIKPILYRVILKLDPTETKTESGIVIPDMVIEKERKAVETGTVVALGSTVFKDYGESSDIVKVGDRVYIARYAGKELIDTDGTKYVAISDVDIISIIED